MQEELPQHEIVLVGVGHTHAHLVRKWRMNPLPDARLTCITNFPTATYSGMLPGVLAGDYPPQRMEIDLVRLCHGPRLRVLFAEVTGLRPDAKQLLLADRPPLDYDLLSFGVGSVPTNVPASEAVVPIKPMQTFLERLERRLQSCQPTDSLKVVVVGAGAGGVEIALCLPGFLDRYFNHQSAHELTLISANEDVGVPPAAAKLVRRELDAREVNFIGGRRVVTVHATGKITLDDSSQLAADLVIWATGASPPQLLDTLPVRRDERGFLLARNTLQLLEHDDIFAVGDCGTLHEDPTPKAGVYAVRQGPILWDNLQRQLAGRTLRPYQPQREFLKLFNTGDGRAILAYRGYAMHRRWCWKLKDYIDGSFMDKYQDYRPMQMPMTSPRRAPASSDAGNDATNNGHGEDNMQCAGCGSKLPADILHRVLARLEIPASDEVLLGLSSADDVAMLRTTGQPISLTTDFFPSPLEDPYLVGRIAAVHAASDTWACGGQPQAALAMITLPPGAPKQQEALLHEVLSGAVRELTNMGATLVGGHTTEGPQFSVGFTVVGRQDHVLTKGGLNAGDALLLTKPLGTGVLLAALMRGRCPGEHYLPLVAAMLQSNQAAAAVANTLAASAMTDVSGFGLAGHLLEMLTASDVSAELDLSAIPLLPGAARLLAGTSNPSSTSGGLPEHEGNSTRPLESSLAPANRRVASEMEVSDAITGDSAYAALFDPQTSGGLLVGLNPAHVANFVESLAAQGVQATRIGQVLQRKATTHRVRVVASDHQTHESRPRDAV